MLLLVKYRFTIALLAYREKEIFQQTFHQAFCFEVSDYLTYHSAANAQFITKRTLDQSVTSLEVA